MYMIESIGLIYQTIIGNERYVIANTHGANGTRISSALLQLSIGRIQTITLNQDDTREADYKEPLAEITSCCIRITQWLTQPTVSDSLNPPAEPPLPS